MQFSEFKTYVNRGSTHNFLLSTNCNYYPDLSLIDASWLWADVVMSSARLPQAEIQKWWSKEFVDISDYVWTLNKAGCLLRGTHQDYWECLVDRYRVQILFQGRVGFISATSTPDRIRSLCVFQRSFLVPLRLHANLTVSHKSFVPFSVSVSSSKFSKNAII